MAFNNLRKLAVFALSAAMIVSLGACGTSEKSDSAASRDSESSSNTTGYDVSGVTKDDDIAAMLPESVTKDGKLTVGMDTSYGTYMKILKHWGVENGAIDKAEINPTDLG